MLPTTLSTTTTATLSTSTCSPHYQRPYYRSFYQRLHSQQLPHQRQPTLSNPHLPDGVTQQWVVRGGYRHGCPLAPRRLQDPVINGYTYFQRIYYQGLHDKRLHFSTTNSPYLPDGVELWVVRGGDRHKRSAVPRRFQDPMLVRVLPFVPPPYTVDDHVKRFLLVLLFLAPGKPFAYSWGGLVLFDVQPTALVFVLLVCSVFFSIFRFEHSLLRGFSCRQLFVSNICRQIIM